MESVTLQTDHPVDVLPEYIRGGFSGAEEVERHIAGCESCRLEVEMLRALAEPIESPLSDLERARTFRTITARRGVRSGGTAGSAWLRATWRIAAAVALLLTSVGVWRVVQAGGASDWDPDLAMEGWTQELADIELTDGELRMALGAGIIDDPSLDPWAGASVDPGELDVPWEER
jgi:hypothetical protein